jgi:hypothetical protein
MSEELIAQIRRGMNLCSRDYRKWGEVDAVLRPSASSPDEVVVCGRLQETGDPVYVPASAVLTIEGGHCVRVDAPVAEISAQGWDQPPAYLSAS